METHGIIASTLKQQSWKPTIFFALIDPLNFERPVFFPPEHAHKMYHIRQNLQFDVAKKT